MIDTARGIDAEIVRKEQLKTELHTIKAMFVSETKNLYDRAVQQILHEAKLDAQISDLEQALKDGQQLLPGPNPGEIIVVNDKLNHLKQRKTVNHMLLSKGAVGETHDAKIVATTVQSLRTVMTKYGVPASQILTIL